MVLAQLQLVSLLVWQPLDQESVKVMQLPIQWKPLDDNLMQKPKYDVACCFSLWPFALSIHSFNV